MSEVRQIGRCGLSPTLCTTIDRLDAALLLAVDESVEDGISDVVLHGVLSRFVDRVKRVYLSEEEE